MQLSLTYHLNVKFLFDDFKIRANRAQSSRAIVVTICDIHDGETSKISTLYKMVI